jgi:transcriptional regulator with XRE-family HTH domain
MLICALTRNSVSTDAPYETKNLTGMTTNFGTIPRYIDDLNELGGLSVTDVANITGESKATVSRWRLGAAMPQAGTQLVLSDLYYVVSMLQQFYTPGEIRAWLYARHPQLNGARAIELVSESRTEELLRVIDRLDAEVYL